MNVGSFLSASAQTHGRRSAVRWGDRELTYEELDARVNRLSNGLVEGGIKQGDRIAILMWNRPEFLEVLFAGFRIGAVILPINARSAIKDVALLINDSEASVLVYGPEFRGTIQSVLSMCPSLRMTVGVGGDVDDDSIAYENLVVANADDCTVDLPPDAIAWLFYTSGTTGMPKGAMLSHANIMYATIGWCADLMHLTPEDVTLHVAPLTHGAGFHAIAAISRACLNLLLPDPSFDPERILSTIDKERVTSTWMVPTQIRMLMDSPRFDSFDLSSLQWILYGGAPMFVEDIKEALTRFGPVLVQVWAQGETPMTGTVLAPKDHVEGKLLSAGVPRTGIRIRVVDADGLEVSRGQKGQITVNGPTVMLGYWRRESDTQNTIRKGWLHTGDVGYIDEDGFVFIVDRTKDMVISGGVNIYPREIEECLMEHAGVHSVAVIGIPDRKWGESLKALVVLEPGVNVSEEDLLRFCAERLSGYKKPKSIEFRQDLPTNSYGKIMKNELRKAYWEGYDRLV